MKRYLVRNRIKVLYIMLQTILYGIFLTFDFIGSNSNMILSSAIKFSIIILCFCYALSNCIGHNVCCNRKEHGRSIIINMEIALFFTVVSDLFILILDHYIYGVLTFIIVQQMYALRIIYTYGNKRDKNNLIIEDINKSRLVSKYIIRVFIQLIVTSAVCLVLWLVGVVLDVLLIISLFYFICIATNTITSVIVAVHSPKCKENLLFAVGMVLFLLCDINVGIFNMSGFISMPEQIYHVLYEVSSILMWTFYAPSQVLISLSVSLTCENQQKKLKSLCKNM